MLILKDSNFIYQTIPAFIEVVEGNYGYLIRSCKFIAKDTVIDINISFCFIENTNKYYELFLNDNEFSIPLHSFTNTLYYTSEERVCNGYIGYLNHSCYNSNVRFTTRNKFGFDLVASRDIIEGEELTSNYLLFDYTCDGHMFICSCDVDKCYKNISGFKNLSFIDQCYLINDVTENILHSFCHDNFDSSQIKSLYSLDNIENSFSYFQGEKIKLCNAKIKDNLVASLIELGQLHHIPESVFYIAAYLIIINKINTNNVIIQVNYKDDISLHFMKDYINQSIRDICIDIMKYLQGPPLRVLKYLLHIDTLYDTSYTISFKDINEEITKANTSSDHFDLYITKDYHLIWLYNKLLHEEDEIISLQECFIYILNQIITHFNNKVIEVNIMDNASIENILSIGRNQSSTKQLKIEYIFESIELNAIKNKDKIALETSNTSMSYGELIHRMNELACVLQACHTQPDDVISIMMNRNCDLIVGLLGIMKSGSAYTAILPDFPLSKMKFIIQEDCKSKIIVTLSEFAHYFQWYQGILIFMDKIEEYSKVIWKNMLTIYNLVYITYTSGSTGNPKGVQVEHLQLMQYTQQDTYNIEHVEKYLHSTNITFDIIAIEIYIPLINNKCVYIVENLMISDIPKVGFIQGPSSLLEATKYCDINNDMKESILWVSQIGEKLTEKVFTKFTKLINGYGTAETVNISACKIYNSTITKNNNPLDDIRIVGKPHTFSTIYVLSKRDLSLLPIYMKGDVYIGGCLARGYLNLSQLTNAKYIQNPFSDEEKLYYTGDIGCWNKYGELMIFGREDNQIKINGVRIELSAIENVTLMLSSISKAIVIYKSKQLYLYWTGVDNSKDMKDKIKLHLQQYLPLSMIPNEYIYMSELPMNANGKINKSALPIPNNNNNSCTSNNNNINNQIKAPKSRDEQLMYSIWKEILHINDIVFSMDDHFFQLGGDSLKLILLLYEIKTKFNILLKISDLYMHDTIESLLSFMNINDLVNNQNNINNITITTSTINNNNNEYNNLNLSAGNKFYISYYQMQYVLWYNINAIIKIKFKKHNLDLQHICVIIKQKFPILQTKLKKNNDNITKIDVNNIKDIELYEIIQINNIENVKEYLSRQDYKTFEIDFNIDIYDQLCKFMILTYDNSIVLAISHILFDGYSVENLFNFIDKISFINNNNNNNNDHISNNNEIDDYNKIISYLNNNINDSYILDLRYWEDMLLPYQMNVTLDTKPFKISFEDMILTNMNPYEIIKYINDLMPFNVLFHINTSILRSNNLLLYENGCLLYIDKYSSIKEIEDMFKKNLKYAAIPIYILINKFNLKNMIYINHAIMKYNLYNNIEVSLTISENMIDNSKGHYPLTIFYYDDNEIKIGIQDPYYYINK